MTRMAWLGVAASLLGALVLAVVIWVAGPLIGVGDVRPAVALELCEMGRRDRQRRST